MGGLDMPDTSREFSQEPGARNQSIPWSEV